MSDIKNELIIFTDGSALGNPGPGGYGAVLVFPALDEVIELGGNKATTTNNEMELTAVIAALSHASHGRSPVTVYTDSSYVVKGITSWVKGWERNGWRTKSNTPVAHQPLWEQLVALVREREQYAPFTWHLVEGHAGLPGNERADVIATSFAEAKPTELYRGRLGKYQISVLDVAYHEAALQEKKDKRDHAKAKAYSYLSLIDGVLKKHTTWAECEARVKGVQDAKFRKATSKDHEASIIREWGISP